MFSLSGVGSSVHNSVLDFIPVAIPISPNRARSLPEGRVVEQFSVSGLQSSSQAAMNEVSANTRNVNLSKVNSRTAENDLERGEPRHVAPVLIAPSTIPASSTSPIQYNLNVRNLLRNGAAYTLAGAAELAVASLSLALPASASAACAATGHAIMGIHHNGYDVSEGVKSAVTGTLLVGVPSYVLGRFIGIICRSTNNAELGILVYRATLESFSTAFLSSVIGAAFRQNEMGINDDVSLAHHCLAGLVGGLIIGGGISCLCSKSDD
ncbi:MAG: hypothetical protein V4629_06910 [Pseudomonadota bacterium]